MGCCCGLARLDTRWVVVVDTIHLLGHRVTGKASGGEGLEQRTQLTAIKSLIVEPNRPVLRGNNHWHAIVNRTNVFVGIGCENGACA